VWLIGFWFLVSGKLSATLHANSAVLRVAGFTFPCLQSISQVKCWQIARQCSCRVKNNFNWFHWKANAHVDRLTQLANEFSNAQAMQMEIYILWIMIIPL